MAGLGTLLGVALALGLGNAAATAETCADPGFEVHAPGADLAARLCTLAQDAKAQLVACGLRQTELIAIRVVPVVDSDHAECAAAWDCASREIRLLHPDAMGTALSADSPYRVLPAEVLLAGVLTHELAHALLMQTAGTADIAFVDHEYVAAAMEYAALPADWRAALIAAAPVSLPPKPGLVAPMIYGLAPRKFATNAWQHFSLPENGCPLVQRIAAGAFTFMDQLR